MSKVFTLSLLITILISKLAYFRDKMLVKSEDEIGVLRESYNFLVEYIYLDKWSSIEFMNMEKMDLANNIVNYFGTYFIPIFLILLVLRELKSGKKREKMKFFSKYSQVVNDELIHISTYDVYLKMNNILRKGFDTKKINFGPYKGSLWKDLNEDYVVYLFNNEQNPKYRKFIDTALFNHHKKYYS